MDIYEVDISTYLTVKITINTFYEEIIKGGAIIKHASTNTT